MSNNTPHLVAQPLQYDEDIDLRNDDDLRRTVIHAAQSLSEDEDLSAIAFLQQSGPRDLMLFTPKHGDIGTLADAFDLRGALEDIIMVPVLELCGLAERISYPTSSHCHPYVPLQ